MYRDSPVHSILPLIAYNHTLVIPVSLRTTAIHSYLAQLPFLLLYSPAVTAVVMKVRLSLLTASQVLTSV